MTEIPGATMRSKEDATAEMFRGMSSLFGPISKETQQLLLSFYNNPCSDTWDQVAYNMIIGGSTTPYELWVQFQPGQQSRKNVDGLWNRFPDPERLMKWIQIKLDIERKHAMKMVRDLELELEFELEIEQAGAEHPSHSDNGPSL